jgi:hypothetical protein
MCFSFPAFTIWLILTDLKGKSIKYIAILPIVGERGGAVG